MTDSQGLEVGDFVVRRKRKRHTSSLFCCCREPGIDFLKNFQGLISGGSEGFLVTPKLNSLSGYSDNLFDFSPGDAAHMDLDDRLSVNARESPSINHANSSDTSIPSSELHVSLEPNSLDTDTGTVITVDSFLKNCHGAKTRMRKTYRAKYRVLSDLNERTATPKPTSRADILQLRSRRVVRASSGPVLAHTPADADNDAPASPLSRKSKRQLARQPGKQKRRHLAERLIDAVVRTSGQPNIELLQVRCKEGDLRVPITLETVPRSLIPDKPRKWSLVDPRKVITPFRVSTFSTKRGRKALTEQTPTSYECVALHRHAPVVTREAVDIDVQQESSSPCQRKVRRGSLVKKSRVRFCEPLKMDVVSVDAVNNRKCTRKSRTKAATSGLDSRRSKARTPLECEALGEQEVHLGRRSLNMVPVPTRLPALNTAANKLDDAAAYSGTCPSQSQANHGFLPVTMSPPTASIPSSSVSELPTSPTVLSPIASSDKNGSQAINKGSPTLDFDGSYPTLESRLKTLGFSKKLGKTIAEGSQDLQLLEVDSSSNEYNVDNRNTIFKA